jgi:uncharacterized repeat protein (TIGR01451 family)
VDYVTVPPGWTEGMPISGQQLWPGAAIDALGNRPTGRAGPSCPTGAGSSIPPRRSTTPAHLGDRVPREPDDLDGRRLPAASEGCAPYNSDVDLRVLKTHDEIDGDAVEQDDVIDYRITITNDGTTPATGVTFNDVLPDGLVVVPGSPSGPADWTFTITPGGLQGVGTEPLAPERRSRSRIRRRSAELPRGDIAVVLGDLTNQVCVDSIEPDMNEQNNCGEDTVKTKSIALEASALCVNNTPYVNYAITPNNVPSPLASGRDDLVDGGRVRGSRPGIDAGDLRGPRSPTAPVRWTTCPVPPGWTNGTADHRSTALAGRRRDALGNPTDWPGWTELPDGSWISIPRTVLRPPAHLGDRVPDQPDGLDGRGIPPASEECGPAESEGSTSRSESPTLRSTGDAVDSGDGDVIEYTITITNLGARGDRGHLQ